MKCPICDSNGTLHEVNSKIVAHPLPGISIDVSLPFLECSNCGEEIAAPGEIQSIGERIKQAKLTWLAENIEKDECIPVILKELRSLLNVTQREFSELIGATGNSVSKYELGTIIPTSMAKKFIALLAMQPEIFEMLRSINRHQSSNRNTVCVLPGRSKHNRFTMQIGRELSLSARGWSEVAVTTVKTELTHPHKYTERLTSTTADFGYISLAAEWEGSIDLHNDGEPASSMPPTYPGFFNTYSSMN